MPQNAVRWPSQIPGETVPPSDADIQTIEGIQESRRFHGEGEGAEAQLFWERLIPVLDAAKDPDIRRLRGLLADGRFPPDCMCSGYFEVRWRSALNEAIFAGLGTHARLLVESGADPNAFFLRYFELGSSEFTRGRPTRVARSNAGSSPSRPKPFESFGRHLESIQLSRHLTTDEIRQRRGTRSRFWTESNLPPLQLEATKHPLSSLTACILAGDTDTYEFLAEHGADESAWIRQVSCISGLSTVSTLALKSPLQAAVEVRRADLVSFLLERGHRPDVFPVSRPTCALNPLLTAVEWHEGMDLMLPESDLNKRTPVFDCHILHVAVATLDVPLVEKVLRATGPAGMDVMATSLMHSLLHVACLPYTDDHVNLYSKPVYESMREFRTLALDWKSQELRSEANSRGATDHLPAAAAGGRRGGRGRGTRGAKGYMLQSEQIRSPEGEICQVDTLPRFLRAGLLPVPVKHLPGRGILPATSQASMVRYLLTHLPDPASQLRRQDVHGNNPLHYLASMRDVDPDLLCEAITVGRDGMYIDVTLSDLSAAGLTADANEAFADCCTTRKDDPDPWTAQLNHWGHAPRTLYHSNLKERGHRNEMHMPSRKGTIAEEDAGPR